MASITNNLQNISHQQIEIRFTEIRLLNGTVCNHILGTCYAALLSNNSCTILWTKAHSMKKWCSEMTFQHK